MAPYELAWITDQLATGHMPMSSVDFDQIRAGGIDAIINLCGEFCDLKEVEAQSGFEVHYLPIPDECAPDTAAMEHAFVWLDEALSRGRKILVHCRYGVGRSNTFLFAYFLHQGHDLKGAKKKVGAHRANSMNYCQWQFLKKYSQKPAT
jgi:protein-tyrosine phosphatase